MKDLLGEGKFAKVHSYQLPDKDDDDQFFLVAIKTFKAQAKRSTYQDMLKEFNVMRTFDSDFLVQAYDYNMSSRYLKIAMELCEYSLDEFLSKSTPSRIDITAIFSDIVSGLSVLHDRSVIHRDLHPGNILFGGDNWKLSDFGSSRLLDNLGMLTSNIGCRFYRSSESNCNDYGKEVDVYSLGVVCFDILLAFSNHSYFCSEYKKFRDGKNLFTLDDPRHTLRRSFTRLCTTLTDIDRAKRLKLRQCKNAFKNAIQSEEDIEDDDDDDDDEKEDDDDDNSDNNEDDDDDIVMEISFQSMGIRMNQLYHKKLMTKVGLKQAISDSQNKLVISNDLVVCLSKRFVPGHNPGNVKKRFRKALLKLLGITEEDGKNRNLSYATATILGVPLL